MNITDFNKIFPFEKPRKYQKEIIEAIIDQFSNGKKIVMLNAPTGIGKSAIAYAVAQYYKESYILTSQKTLQDQYVNDFRLQPRSIYTVKGRANYYCNRNQNARCDMGMCKKDGVKCKDCPYKEAKHAAYTNSNTILNYAYFLSMSAVENSPQKKRNLLVLDEAHGVETELLNFYTLDLNYGDIKEHALEKIFTIPSIDKTDDEKIDWLIEDVLPSLMDSLQHYSDVFDDMNKDDVSFAETVKKITYLTQLISNAERIIEYDDDRDNIVVIQNGHFGIQFKPLYCGDIFERNMVPFGNRVLMMSATMISKEQLCKDLSLDMSEVSYINCPFIFNIDNMPIYPLNAGKMNYGTKEKTLPKMVEFIKELMDEHKSERGIIHTVSYDIAEYITNNIKTDRFIIPKGKDRDKKIQEFMKSKRNDLILLSPSLTEGISLNDDLSRFSIICKLPFASLGDKFVKTRMELDNEWYSVNTVKNLIQMTGRSIRSETDYAATYVLDSGFSWFIQKNKKYFPKWWLKAIQN